MTVLHNWRDLAECRDLVTADDDPFFGEGEDDERAAIAICRLCPVQSECLSYAIRTGQEYGVWGGKPQRELRRLVALDRRGRVRVGQVPEGHPNAGKAHCKHGHPFNAANTYYAPDGSRRCRACLRAAYRVWSRRARRQGGRKAGGRP